MAGLYFIGDKIDKIRILRVFSDGSARFLALAIEVEGPDDELGVCRFQ